MTLEPLEITEVPSMIEAFAPIKFDKPSTYFGQHDATGREGNTNRSCTDEGKNDCHNFALDGKEKAVYIEGNTKKTNGEWHNDANDEEIVLVESSQEISFTHQRGCAPTTDTNTADHKNRTGDFDEDYPPQSSFCADTPYYAAFVEKEMQSVATTINILKDIESKATAFRKAGDQMVSATRRLSMSCRLHHHHSEAGGGGGISSVANQEEMEQRRNALGLDIAEVLERLGFALEEIATAQETMCKNVQAAIGSNLKHDAVTALKEAQRLKEEADGQTEKAEQLYFKYLSGKEAGGNSGIANGSNIISNRKGASKHGNFAHSNIGISDQNQSSKMSGLLGLSSNRSLGNSRHLASSTFQELKGLAGSSSRSLNNSRHLASTTFQELKVKMRSSYTTGMGNFGVGGGGGVDFVDEEKTTDHGDASRNSNFLAKRSEHFQANNIVLSLRGIGSSRNPRPFEDLRSRIRNSCTGGPGIGKSCEDSAKTDSDNSEEGDENIQFGDFLNQRQEPPVEFSQGSSCQDESLSDEKDIPEEEEEQKVGNFPKLWKRGRSSNGNSTCNSSNNPLSLSGIVGKQQQSEKNLILAKAKEFANAKHNLHQIRVSQAEAEYSRLLLSKFLVENALERKIGLCQTSERILGELKTYFHIGSLITDLEPCADGSCSKGLSVQKNKIIPLWEDRHNRVARTMSEMRRDSVDAFDETKDIEEIDDPTKLILDIDTLTHDKIEKETQIWDIASALAESSRFRRVISPFVLLEGWLYQKNSNRMTGILQQTWARRWFLLQKNGVIFYMNSNTAENRVGGRQASRSTASSRVRICNVSLCNVQELSDEQSARFCFQILTPEQKPLILQARGPTDLRMWIDGIRSAMNDQLAEPIPNPLQSNQEVSMKHHGSAEVEQAVEKMATFRGIYGYKNGDINCNDCDNHDDFKETDGSNLRTAANEDGHINECGGENVNDTSLPVKCQCRQMHPLVKQFLDINSTCADCGQDSPSWASLSLGIALCKDCSATHRSLGANFNKLCSVRSDPITDQEIFLLLSLGNDFMNSVWEINGKVKKILMDFSEQSDRAEWIKSKYIGKEYLAKSSTSGGDNNENAYNRHLYDSAKQGDVMKVASAIAHGGNVNWKNDEQSGKTALHSCLLVLKNLRADENQAVSSMRTTSMKAIKAIECCVELLLQNGAMIGLLDYEAVVILKELFLNKRNDKNQHNHSME